MSKKVKSHSKKAGKGGMSERTKLSLVVLASTVLVVGGGVWAYWTFTTIAPPELASTRSEDAVSFLGNSRGFSRMPVQQREAFLVSTYQRYSKGADRDQFNRDLRRMSRSERQVFLDAIVDIGQTRVMEHAQQYNNIRGKKDRSEFVDNAIRTFDNMRMELGGTGPGTDLGSPFKNDLPQSSDDWMNIVISRTSSHERAMVKPLVEAVAARIQEMRRAQALR